MSAPASALCEKYSPRRVRPDMLVLHATAVPLAAAMRILTTSARQVSAHYLIERNGYVHHLVAEHHCAWHAGKSWWDGARNLNARSIGIELDYEPRRGRGKQVFPPFPEAQLQSLIALGKTITARHKIPASRVLAHSDIAPDRKWDPGNALPWQRLARAGLGVWPQARARAARSPSLRRKHKGDAVAELQRRLARIGYGISHTGAKPSHALSRDGVFGAQTEHVVRAFQRHYRATRADGVADAPTQNLIASLLARLRRA